MGEDDDPGSHMMVEVWSSLILSLIIVYWCWPPLHNGVKLLLETGGKRNDAGADFWGYTIYNNKLITSV